MTVTATTKTDSIPAIQRQYSLEIVSPDIDPALSASDAEIDQVSKFQLCMYCFNSGESN